MQIKKDDWKLGGFYRAQVKDNADPQQLGRIKIWIAGIFQGITVSDLPWAAPAMPLFCGSGSDHGSFNVPEVDSWVWVFFEGEDFNQPVYFAEAPNAVHGLPSERTTNYPDRKILKTKNGIVIYIDDSTGTLKLSLPSGGTVDVAASGDVTISQNLHVSGNVEVDGTIDSKSGYKINGTAGDSGTFTTQDSKTVTVEGGLIKLIV